MTTPDYNQAIRLNPNFADAYFNRGNARDCWGDEQGARSDLQQAAKLFEQQGDPVFYQQAMYLIGRLQQ